MAFSRVETWTVITPSGNPFTDHRAVGYVGGNIVVAYWITDGATPNYIDGPTTSVWRSQTYQQDGTLLGTVDVPNALEIPDGSSNYLCATEPTLSFWRGLFLGVANGRWFKNGAMVNNLAIDGGPGITGYYAVDGEFVYYNGKVFTLASSVGPSDAYLVRFPAPGAVPSSTYDARVMIQAGTSGGQFTLVLSDDDHLYVNGSATMRKYDANLNLLETWTAAGSGSGSWTGGSLLPRGGWMICSNTFLLRKVAGDFLSGDYVLYQMLTEPTPWAEIGQVPIVATPPLFANTPLWDLYNGQVLADDGVLSVCSTVIPRRLVFTSM